MKRFKRKNIGYKKERVVLSDILPYEVPPFFSNRDFYHFLINNKVELFEKKETYREVEIRFKKDSTEILEKLVRLVFGIRKDVLIHRTKGYDYFKLKSIVTIPFNFKIAHKKSEFRSLTVIHPLNQLSLIGFYDEYKYDLIYYTGLSRLSLRYPVKISSLKYFRDQTHRRNKARFSELEIIETENKEYLSLKSYFSYRRYNNINEFYESSQFHRAERRFGELLKFDVAKCFDSIYTHTLPWSIYNKKIVKDNVIKQLKLTFGNRFDVLMQKMNYNETNGIVIGSEFSRIFAEIILQDIDNKVLSELEHSGLVYKLDFDIFRYVDDYFVFGKSSDTISRILECYRLNLRKYNLFFNESKTKPFVKPIITNISIAKELIRDLVERTMFLKFYDTPETKEIGLKFYSAKDVITNYKKALALSNTSYKDLQNYFLAILFNKTKELIRKYEKNQSELFNFISKHSKSKEKHEEDPSNEELKARMLELEASVLEKTKQLKRYHNQIFKSFQEIIELTFFVYSVLPKVSFSIKVSHILFRIIDFIKNQERTKQHFLSKVSVEDEKLIALLAFSYDEKHNIFKGISDNIDFIFKGTEVSLNTPIETLYLLQVSKELGVNYLFSEDILINHFNITITNGGVNNELNYFTIISLLSYIQRLSRYDRIRDYLRRIITYKFIRYENKDAELSLLIVDLLNCPYLANSDDDVIQFQQKVLDLIKFFDDGTSTIQKRDVITKLKKNYSLSYFRWINQDLGIELNTKRGHNVY